MPSRRLPKASTGPDVPPAYDYIVVGSGSAGSLIANRLSADSDCRVLVLEAGGRDRGFWLRLPVGYFRSIYDSRFSRLFRTEPGSGVADRRIDCPRGRVVGGSSSINGLIFIRGQHEDYDDWAAGGATGWAFSDVLPYFRRFERNAGAPSQFRGAHGELPVSDLRNRNAACTAWMEAARSTGLPENADFNAGSTYGIGAYQLTLDGHWRASAATAFLRPALARPNLSLKTGCHVSKVVFENRRAAGVEVLQGGRRMEIRAAREVILCAGAIQSPQILQLSGIGPADLLRQFGIPVLHDAPQVGENLQDHLQMRTIVELTGRDSLNDHVRNPVRLAAMGLAWLFKASGPLTVGAGQVGGAVRTRYARNGRPDLQLFVMPLSVDKPGTPLHAYSGFTTALWQCHPESRGHVRITGPDPLADPLIQPNYLTADHDARVMVEGVRIVRDIYRQPAFRDLWKAETVPGDRYATDAEILDACRSLSTTVYHHVGTCRMGSDAEAVVDPTLRVNGVDGLRVVDASVMPTIPSANTNAPTMMIAEKAAAMIVGSVPTAGPDRPAETSMTKLGGTP